MKIQGFMWSAVITVALVDASGYAQEGRVRPNTTRTASRRVPVGRLAISKLSQAERPPSTDWTRWLLVSLQDIFWACRECGSCNRGKGPCWNAREHLCKVVPIVAKNGEGSAQVSAWHTRPNDDGAGIFKLEVLAVRRVGESGGIPVYQGRTLENTSGMVSGVTVVDEDDRGFNIWVYKPAVAAAYKSRLQPGEELRLFVSHSCDQATYMHSINGFPSN